MASPYDLRKKNRQAQLHQVREEARQRMQTVAKLERRGHDDRMARQDIVGQRSQPKVDGPEGRTGPAKPVNAERFPSIAGPRQAQATRRLWEIAAPGRGATRGTMVIKPSQATGALQTYYRRKRDGKAIPIDSSGRVIRRSGTSR